MRAFLREYERNPISKGGWIGLAVGGVVTAAIVTGIVLYEKSAAAKAAGGSATPKTITVSYTNAVPGTQPTVHANAGDTIIFQMPSLLPQGGGAGTKWVDESTGGLTYQGQTVSAAGTAQLVYKVTGSGTLAAGWGTTPPTGVYATSVVVP